MEEFKNGSVPVIVVARVYGKDPAQIRAGIISGWLPIGKATRHGQLITDVKQIIDPWLINDIYLNKRFPEYFDNHAALPQNDIYPTVTVRSIMYALHMKPLPKEKWETVFYRSQIQQVL